MGLFINRFWPQNPPLLHVQEVLAGPESVPHPANHQTNSQCLAKETESIVFIRQMCKKYKWL